MAVCPTCRRPLPESAPAKRNNDTFRPITRATLPPSMRGRKGGAYVSSGEFNSDGTPVMIDISDPAAAEKYYASDYFKNTVFPQAQAESRRWQMETAQAAANALEFTNPEAQAAFEALRSAGIAPGAEQLAYIRKNVSPQNQGYVLNAIGADIANAQAERSAKDAARRQEYRERFLRSVQQDIDNYTGTPRMQAFVGAGLEDLLKY